MPTADPERDTAQELEPEERIDGAPVEMLLDSVGRYLPAQLVGRGSTGEIWRAEDPEIGRTVALKLLRVPQDLSESERIEWEQRFLQEARAAGRLSHPGIVPIYDVGKATDGRPFIVMELIEGHSLEAILKQEAGAPPSPAVSLLWGAQVAEALDAAHRRGIVHRDIKPANILIDGEGQARIADFGIARLSESEITRTGLFLGSPAYTSPEQIRGGNVDGRADLFSLGASLYSLLTGVRPFPAEDLTSLVYAICHREPSPPTRQAPGLPPECDAVLLKALAKDPERRYRNGREMAADLRAVAEGRSPSWCHVAPAIEEHGPKSQASVPVLLRLLRGCRAATRLWARGWSQGPRVRAAMVIGLALALAAITWGSVLLIQRIERVVIQFEQASHELFAEWLSLRPATLKGAAVGTQEGTPGALGRLEFIFVECSDVSEPRMVSIDVRKTDSVLSPFLGIIHVETNESCVRRPVWASGWVGKDKQEALIAACVGKPYDECIAARGKPMAKRLDRPFSYSGHLTIFYRRSKGQWMFDREDSAEPKAVETSGT